MPVCHLCQEIFMIVRLTQKQWGTLFYWGRDSAGCDGANEAVLLLLDVLCEMVPVPGPHDPRPETRRARPVGAARYDYYIAAPALTRSPRTRALWAWGHARGCTTVAASLRYLISLVRQAYPHLSGSTLTKVSRPECLAELARLIVEKGSADLEQTTD